MALGRLGPCEIRYRPIEAYAEEAGAEIVELADTAVALRHRTTGARGVRAIDSRYFGYVPTAMLVALAVAVPVAWRRRTKTLLWGLLLVHAFVSLRVLLYLLDELSSGNALAIVELPPPIKSILSTANETLASSTLASFVVPFLLWVLLAVRLEDWLAGPAGEERPPRDPAR
jgi:hypothetical protein